MQCHVCISYHIGNEKKSLGERGRESGLFITRCSEVCNGRYSTFDAVATHAFKFSRARTYIRHGAIREQGSI